MRCPMLMTLMLVLALYAWPVAGAGIATRPKAETLDLELALDLQSASLATMRENLAKLEAQMAAAHAQAESVRRRALENHPGRAADAPPRFEEAGLLVTRASADRGLVFDLSARRVSLVRVLHAIAVTAGLPVTVDSQVAQERFNSRVDVDLRQTPLYQVLEILTGMQDLDYLVDDAGIMITSVAAAGRATAADRLAEKALENYERALVLSPSPPDEPGAYLGIARYHAATKDDASAIQALTAMLEKFPEAPETPEALLLLGRCRQNAGFLEGARACYFAYLDGFPQATDQDQVLMDVADTYIAAGNQEEAVGVYDRIGVNYPNSPLVPRATYAAASRLLALARYDGALARLDKFTETFSGHPLAAEVLYAAARCHFELKEYEAARYNLNRMLDLSPSPALEERAYYLFGDTYLATDNILVALEVYTGAQSSFREGAMATEGAVRLTQCYARLGLYEALERRLSQLPMEWRTGAEGRALLLPLCRHYAALGSPDRATALLQAVNWPASGEAAEVMATRAFIFLARELPDLAIQECTRALEEKVDDKLGAEIHRILGEAYRRKGELAQATRAYGGTLP